MSFKIFFKNKSPEIIYLTVRACKSVGAPERTAAATESPGSLPSITRFGTGEKLLVEIFSIGQCPQYSDSLTRWRGQWWHCNLADDEPLPLQVPPL
jgi:hypothetical protein